MAQETSAEEPSRGGVRFSFGGEAALAVSPEDHGYFNYSTEAYSVLRLVRFDGTAALAVGSRLSVVGDLRLQGDLVEGGWEIRPYALFARIRPVPATSFDIQVGLIPPVFGAFSRRTYGADNPLIGIPLGYQYVTTLRPDALPASADNLLAKRGRGWLVRYPVGNSVPDHGVPLVDGLRYPAGIEVHVGGGSVQASAAVTTGSLSIPNARDAGWSPQISGRLEVRPTPGLILGASASHGTFLERSLADSIEFAGGDAANSQTGLGMDVEYSRGYWIARAEGIWSRWSLPQSAPPFLAEPLGAFALAVEGRYRIFPGLYAAIRLDGLTFSDVCGSTACLPWDAPVRRIEAGGGYSIRRHILVKAAYQYNWRDGSYQPREGLASVQLMVWF